MNDGCFLKITDDLNTLNKASKYHEKSCEDLNTSRITLVQLHSGQHGVAKIIDKEKFVQRCDSEHLDLFTFKFHLFSIYLSTFWVSQAIFSFVSILSFCPSILIWQNINV